VSCNLSSEQPSMHFTHSHHHVSFSISSQVLRPYYDIAVNCLSFHYLLQMSQADRDICWATSKCFCCKDGEHRTEACPQLPRGLVLFCSLLDDPNCKFFGSPLPAADESPQNSIMLLALAAILALLIANRSLRL
jgi:hypothetical protein